MSGNKPGDNGRFRGDSVDGNIDPQTKEELLETAAKNNSGERLPGRNTSQNEGALPNHTPKAMLTQRQLDAHKQDKHRMEAGPSQQYREPDPGLNNEQRKLDDYKKPKKPP